MIPLLEKITWATIDERIEEIASNEALLLKNQINKICGSPTDLIRAAEKTIEVYSHQVPIAYYTPDGAIRLTLEKLAIHRLIDESIANISKKIQALTEEIPIQKFLASEKLSYTFLIDSKKRAQANNIQPILTALKETLKEPMKKILKSYQMATPQQDSFYQDCSLI